MSVKKVNKTTGATTKVAGLVNSEKVNTMYGAFPSDASASNKLVSDATADEKISDESQVIFEVMGKNGAKNLLPYPYYETTKTVNGITFTDNGDGTVTVNGTAVGTANFIIANEFAFTENESYMLTGCPSGGASDTYRQYVITYGGDTGEGKKITPTSESGLSKQIVMQVFSGTTLSNVTFKPMLRLASDTDSTYQPYAMSNKELTDKKQNITDETLQTQSKTIPGAINELKNSVFKATDTSFALIDTLEGGALANTIYGMSVQDGTPTPTSPVEIKSAKANFKCVGKNLIPYPYFRQDEYVTNGITFKVNSDKSISFSGSTDTDAYYTLINITSGNSFPLKTNTRYKLITDCSSNFVVSVFINAVTSGSTGDIIIVNAQNEKKVSEFTTPVDFNNRLQVGIFVHQKTNISGTIKVSIVQADVTDTEYTPYQHTDATSGLTLRAIEVTSTDDYNLEKDGKYYIADTVDWSDDKGFVVTRRVGHFSVDGSESWQLVDSGTSNERYHVSRSDLGIGDIFSPSKIKSNRFTYNQSNSGPWGTCRLGSSWLALFDNTHKHGANVNTLKDWLAGNPTYFEYILETPTTESVTPEQAMALLSLKTYDEATSIYCVEDVAPVVDLEYSSNRASALALTGHNEGYIAQELEGKYGVKNLISYPYYDVSRTINGVTITNNSDGSVTFNGTATAIVFHNLTKTGFSLTLKKGTYILSRGEYTKDNINLTVQIDSTTGATYPTRISPTIISLSEDHPYKCYVSIPSGTVLDNYTIYPMLRLASFQSDEYEPYAKTNRELTKDANAISPILNVLGAKNLIPYPYYDGNSKTSNGITYTVDSEGVVNVNGTASAISAFDLAKGVNFGNTSIFSYASENLPVGSYILSSGLANGGDADTIFFRYDKDTKNTSIVVKAGASINNVKVYPMIRLASIDDNTYSPYAMTNRELTRDMIYSTSETDTGKRWINGKQIYRKVIECGYGPNGTTATTLSVPHNISNLADVISISGFCKGDSGAYLPLPYEPTNLNTKDGLAVYISNGNVVATTLGFNFSTYKVYAILEYTKTT